MTRDHAIRVLVPWLMHSRHINRDEAITTIAVGGAVGRKALFREKFMTTASMDRKVEVRMPSAKQHLDEWMKPCQP